MSEKQNPHIGNQNARKPEHLKRSGARLVISCTKEQKDAIQKAGNGNTSRFAVEALMKATEKLKSLRGA